MTGLKPLLAKLRMACSPCVSLVGSKSGETYQLGDPVDVRLVEAAPFAGALRFELLTEGRKGKPLGRTAVLRAAKSAKARDRKARVQGLRKGR